jgi:hypothetical protein
MSGGSIFGLVILGLVLLLIATNLRDLWRYIKMTMM